MVQSKWAMPTQNWRLMASISLVAGSLGVAYWLYRNKRYTEEKSDIREDRFKLVEEFAEITSCN